ncbi:MAG: VapC toxin family PIN domain ribonuclease [Rickettsiales bacterium]|nr:MAG: VapC toxin family PIN domain ribonuclease [Rickettsiales bacterium]
MYLLDSCAISDFMKGDKNTSEKLKSILPSEIYTSTITQMEIQYGLIRRFDHSHRYFGILEDFLSAITVLPFDRSAASHSAKIRKTLDSQGTPIGAYDVLIAGIAMSANLTLVTSNEREFLRVDGLEIENWRTKKCRT